MNFKDYLRSDSVGLELGEVLRSSPQVLLGVDAAAVHALTGLGINTVFDLAGSSTFGAASTVLRAVVNPANAGHAGDQLPSDLFAVPRAGMVQDAADLDVSALRLVAASGSNGAVGESLDVRTIRDLALWPPYAAARAILNESVGASPGADEGPPSDLLPAR